MRARPAGRLSASRMAVADGTTLAARRHRPDYWLVMIALLLIAIGVVVVYSIGPALSAVHDGKGTNYVLRQSIAICLSIVAFLITSRIPLEQWRRWRWLLLGLAGVGTLIALITPVIPQYPAHRWIRLGGLSLQSVEVVKFALLIGISSFFAARATQGTLANGQLTTKPLLYALGLLGVVVAGIQSDLGSTVVIMAMVVAMAFVIGMPMKKLILIGLAIAIGGVLAISSTPYRRARLATYLHPAANCTTTGYQACQALIAVGSGGIAGLGLGKSVQAYGYLPEAQNDSIFAIYAEKFGFIGSMTLLMLFMMLFARLRLIIERAPDDFSRLIVTGVLAWLSVQTIINIGAMLGLLPLKGITLPFISYGGTSVLFVGAALGLVFQISRYTAYTTGRNTYATQRTQYEGTHDRRRVRGAYNPAPGSRS
jgi:cell division protein FtsW